MWYGNNSKLGLLGGGQLGRMLIQAAVNYDIHVYVMDHSKTAPCGRLAYDFTEGDITSYEDVMAFGKDKDVLTIEIEHVNVDALETLEKQGVKVYPQPRVLRIIQDKGLQKTFYKENAIPTAPFELIEGKEELRQYQDRIPFIQKSRKGGYDGKGVFPIYSKKDLSSAFAVPSLIEDKIDFQKELSVLVARNKNGEVKTFPVVECEFSEELNLVEFLFSPANISQEIAEKAAQLGEEIITKLDMTGLLAVELFLTKDKELLVNEVAPRPHNSGHHTIECNKVSQFEQHLRSILNLPLGNTDTLTPGVMVNLLGEEGEIGPARYEGLEEALKIDGVYPHLYGKAQKKPHRKMGHVTVTASTLEKAMKKARKVQKTVRISTFNT